MSIIFLACIGKLSDVALQLLETRLLRWADTVKR
jgi:ABC-type nitrate/sulfonate/bicarbonate transport system permease component